MFNPPLFLSLIPVLIGALVVFDRLVWREYVSHSLVCALLHTGAEFIHPRAEQPAVFEVTR